MVTSIGRIRMVAHEDYASGLWQVTTLTLCVITAFSYLAVTIEILRKHCRMMAGTAVTVSFLHNCHSYLCTCIKHRAHNPVHT